MGDLVDWRKAAVENVRQALRQRIRTAGISHRRIEVMSGLTDGRLSAVLDGGSTLTVHHLLAVLKAVDVKPAAFFRELEGGYDLAPERMDEVAEGGPEALDQLDLIERLRRLP